MKLRPTLALLAGLAAAACSGEPPEPPPAETAAAPTPSADELALTAHRDAWLQAFNGHQAAAMAELYADSAWFLNADGSYDATRDAILAGMEEATAMSPTASLTGGESMILGDMAVAWGTYTMQVTPPEGTPVGSSGAYLVLHTKADGAWKLLGGINNYDSARPEGWAYAPADDEVPPDAGTMAELTAAWKTHFDLGHADMVADFYTGGAVVSFPDGPVLRGRQAIAAALQERMTARPSHVTFHNVGTIPLGEEWAFDGGWYQLTPPDGGAPLGTGSYLHLVRRQADGTWKIHWGVANSYPASSAM